MSELQLSPNSLKVLEARYLQRDKDRNVTETPKGLFHRVAQNIAEAERRYSGDVEKTAEQFYDLMTSLDFLPNSPTLMNAGGDLQQLAACFVLPVEDSMEGIFDAVKDAAMIQKSGGGTGFSFSRLRPKNDIVRSTGGVASGPISFMQVFDAATNTIKQGGKRRGANMGVLRVDHPDILEFITCKQNEHHLNNFNISVAITDTFMEAVVKDTEYDLINPHHQEPVARLRARQVFNLIVQMAHANGEPGVLFIDRINRDNPTPQLGPIESTNPCGEQPLLPYEACNLGSINLAQMVKGENDHPVVDFDRLARVTRESVHFLDNVIDMNRYPLNRIADIVQGNRKIGLGIMGWADLLVRLGIPYNSEEAIALAETIMGFIDEQSKSVSRELAATRGAFPNIEGSIYDESIRNATTTTIAPTGSISIIANCSSGIEPLFAISYERHVMDSTLIEVHPYFEQVARERGFYSPELMEQIAREGSIRHMEEIPADVRRAFVTAHDITPEWHIRMQAAFQLHTDNAVSKTVNFPHEATQEDVAQAFQLAYTMGCKGVTVYRDGSRSGQVLQTKKEKTDGETLPVNAPVPRCTECEVLEDLAETSTCQTPENDTNSSCLTTGCTVSPTSSMGEGKKSKRRRPQVTFGTTEQAKIGCGKLYVTINSDEHGICEVFTSTGRGGGCRSQSEATSRLISLALRSGVPIEEIIHQLRGIRCPAAVKRTGVENVSCPDAIARAIERFLTYTQGAPFFPGSLAEVASTSSDAHLEISITTSPFMSHHEEEDYDFLDEDSNGSAVCPDCGTELQHEGGCVICRSCGYSKCG